MIVHQAMLLLCHILDIIQQVTGGAFIAESVGVVGNEYTSRLDVVASLSLNNTIISCTIAAQVLIGSDIITVGGR